MPPSLHLPSFEPSFMTDTMFIMGTAKTPTFRDKSSPSAISMFLWSSKRLKWQSLWFQHHAKRFSACYEQTYRDMQRDDLFTYRKIYLVGKYSWYTSTNDGNSNNNNRINKTSGNKHEKFLFSASPNSCQQQKKRNLEIIWFRYQFYSNICPESGCVPLCTKIGIVREQI